MRIELIGVGEFVKYMEDLAKWYFKDKASSSQQDREYLVFYKTTGSETKFTYLHTTGVLGENALVTCMVNNDLVQELLSKLELAGFVTHEGEISN